MRHNIKKEQIEQHNTEEIDNAQERTELTQGRAGQNRGTGWDGIKITKGKRGMRFCSWNRPLARFNITAAGQRSTTTNMDKRQSNNCCGSFVYCV